MFFHEISGCYQCCKFCISSFAQVYLKMMKATASRSSAPMEQTAVICQKGTRWLKTFNSCKNIFFKSTFFKHCRKKMKVLLPYLVHSGCSSMYKWNFTLYCILWIDVSFRFHPQIRWYQTPDSAIVTVNLRNPESQRCDFFPDRVVYRSVRTRPPMITHLVLISSNIQWSFLSRALYTGGSGYMFSKATVCMN